MPSTDGSQSGGHASRGPADPEGAKAATRCPRCGQTFTADGRFCPFDAAILVRAEDWNPSDDPLLGTVIDHRYEVEALIGQGGMGSVYRVRHVRLGRPFAIKALRRDLADDPEIRERFLREAKTASSVAHPGLVHISDFGYLSDGRPFFVMELLEGSSLRAVLESRGRLAPRRAAGIARRIAEALSVAHEAGIVHRDLKPDNVHVASDDGVKVVDFGLAIAVDASVKRTRSNVAFGTPHYMSPEQAAGEAVDRRADVYALGIVLYEMLTGRVPFDAATHAEVLGQHRTAVPLPPSHVPGVSGPLGELEAVVLRCLAKSPDERFHTLPEVLAALDEAVPGLAAEPSPEPSDGGSTRGRGRFEPPVWALGLGGGVLTALIGLAVARWVRTGQETPTRPEAALAEPSAEVRATPAPEPQVAPEPALASPPAESSAPAQAAFVESPTPARPAKKTEARRAPKPAGAGRSPTRDEIVDPWSR